LTRKRYKENTGPGGILDHNNLACIVTYSRRWPAPTLFHSRTNASISRPVLPTPPSPRWL